MSRKIIGITVGSQLPKPDFAQTNERMGDYIKNKPDFAGLKQQVDDADLRFSELVGDYSVYEQIQLAFKGCITDIDYDAILAFDTSEVIFGTNTSSILGQAILGQMILA